ncbi:MAG: dienelactone hydrolase family protein [Deltaproteobacteria bacterium]|nr:dienelactone hydrolase family protein [Deltaproteobacteria bacterium]
MCRTPVIWIGCVLFALAVAACSSDGGAGAGGSGGGGGADGTPDYAAPGPASVGVLTTSVTDSSRTRTLPVEVWYPATSSGTASDVIDFETDTDRRAALSPLLDAAPAQCVATTTNATRDAPATAGEYPVVLYSHCYTCTRWSAHAVMERLASHGFVVVAPDHEGDTLFDRLEESESALNNALVDVREADIRFLLDAVLGGEVLPEGVTADASQVGMLGHSIGSVTAGRVTQNDPRIAAVVGLAAPMENFVIGGVSVESITVPLGLLAATEDNSIEEPGNVLIRLNFSEANTPAYKIEIVDAGHWSVTNIAGLMDEFLPGCGDDIRQTNDEPFTYVSVESANGHTATFVTAFFAGHLLDDAAGLELLRSNPWPTAAPLQVRE